MHRSSQHGFTLIELVVVIIVLGVLAAFAVPRFMGIDTQARIASVNSLAGTLRSTATMAHSVYLARGNPAKTYEGGIDQRTVLIEFDSLDKAIAAHDSPGYQAALAALGTTAERDLRIIEGVED